MTAALPSLLLQWLALSLLGPSQKPPHSLLRMVQNSLIGHEYPLVELLSCQKVGGLQHPWVIPEPIPSQGGWCPSYRIEWCLAGAAAFFLQNFEEGGPQILCKIIFALFWGGGGGRGGQILCKNYFCTILGRASCGTLHMVIIVVVKGNICCS